MLRNRFGFVAAGGLAALAVTLAVPAIGQESRVAPGLGKQIAALDRDQVRIARPRADEPDPARHAAKLKRQRSCTSVCRQRRNA